jgi:hypothetical protein
MTKANGGRMAAPKSKIKNLKSKISMTSRRTLRFTLLDLHATGLVQVFRRHSIFRLWAPLREIGSTRWNRTG